MALEGTIQDFGLADIFQMIGIQRKTGLLTAMSGKECVVVKFVQGQVVGADNQGVKLEDLLGNVLVRTGRVTQEQLKDALATQRRTLQRLGYILIESEYISEADLRDALHVQVSQIVYRLFRWREGGYKFDSVDTVEYDNNFVPIGAETILMEGARMVDEWPIIERRIKSDRAVFRRTDAAEAAVGGTPAAAADDDLGLGADPEQPEAATVDVKLSPEERGILERIDGQMTIQELAESTTFGEFDTYRIVADLLTRSLVEEVREARVTPGVVPRATSGRLATAALLAVVAAASALSLATLADNPVTPWRVTMESSIEPLRTYASRGRMERIERSIELFFLDTGALPDEIGLLVVNGYLSPQDVLDPWGRPYGYRLDATSYTVTGTDSEGMPDDRLTLSRRFDATRRMILGAGAGS